MQITDLLAQSGAFQSVARDLGIDESQAQSGAAALLPALLEGFQRPAQPGLGGLGELLGQIFGNKDTSRQVAADAAAGTGLDPALLRKMLPLLAMAVAGFMSRQPGAAETDSPAGGLSGGLGGLLGQVLGGLTRR